MTKFQQFYVLTKPKVVQLIVFCSLIGMLLAIPALPSWQQLKLIVLACLGIALVASSAAVFNCLVEKIIDSKMTRTAWRPSAKGQLGDGQIAIFSFILCFLGCLILVFRVNNLTMWLTLVTFIGYAIIYTVLLKPTTPQNIVIGGASGAMPPVLGWAAVTNQLEPMPWLLFLIIFLWTPPHFWALSLYRIEDYKRAGLPMLPATHGSRFTRLQIVYYTLALIVVSVVPVIYGRNSWLYLLVAIYLGWRFFSMALKLWRHYSESRAKATFRYSLVYLALLFFALMIDHYLISFAWIGTI